MFFAYLLYTGKYAANCNVDPNPDHVGNHCYLKNSRPVLAVATILPMFICFLFTTCYWWKVDSMITLVEHRIQILNVWFIQTPTRTPNEAFFHWNPELFGLGRHVGQINFGAFGVFSAKLSAPILVQWVPCPCFPLFNHHFCKKLRLFIHIPNIYLGLEFEFRPQRIWDLASVCP